MRATTPILMCDHEDGCDETTTDFYEMLASNWREIMEKGWTFDPYRDPDAAFCPQHAPEPPARATTALPGTPATPQLVRPAGGRTEPQGASNE